MRCIKTICQMCYFYCGLDVYYQDGRIAKIEGMKEHPANRGSICPKGLASQQVVTDPNRLRTPLLRKGRRGDGQWQEISWEEALTIIAERLSEVREQNGPEAVAYHRGQAPGWVTAMNYVTRFMNTFGSPNLVTHSHLCFQPRGIAHVSTYGGVPEPDFDRARCILLWGFNPVFTALPNYARRIMAAKARGAKLIVVDPRLSQTAAKADLWLQPKPGTDLALALAMAKVLIEERLFDEAFVRDWTTGFEQLSEHLDALPLDSIEQRTGVPLSQIQEAARLFASNAPAVMKEGNGLDQHVNVVQTVRAVALLPALTGNLNIEGGSIFVPPLPFVDVQGRGALPKDWEQRSISTHPLYFRQGNALHDEELLAALETGEPYRPRCLIIQGGDPVAANSNTARTKQLFNQLDFIVVHDLYMTASAEVADLVLPAASFLERDHLVYYRYRPSPRSNMIGLQQQVVPPVGESRSDVDFVFDLARELGMSEAFPWTCKEEAFDWELKPLGITVDDLRSQAEGYQRDYSPEELYRTHGREGFGTASGKVELYSKRLEQFGYDALPRIEVLPDSLQTSEDYPLLCGTGLKLGIHTHTQFHALPWIREVEPDRFLEVHPERARQLDICDGDKVKVESPWGSVFAMARVTEAVDPEVVMLAYGYGQPYTRSGWKSSNDMTPHAVADPISGTTSNRRVPCRVVPEQRAEEPGRKQATGLLVDVNRCVGCYTCELACKQEHGAARLRLHVVGPATDADGKAGLESIPLGLGACDVCQSRLRGGKEPACVAACPTRALSVCSEAEILNRVRDPGVQICAIFATTDSEARQRDV